MKTFAYVLISFFLNSALVAYTIKINNETDSDMIVEISYGGSNVCGSDRWGLPSNSSLEKDVGACCAKSGVKFTAKNGSYNGRIVFYDPPTTGFNLSCRSWSADIKPIGNTFTVETR